MRQSKRAAFLTGLGVLWLGCAGARAEGAKVAEDIKATGERLVAGAHGSPAEAENLVLHLVDVAAAIGEEGRLAEPFRAKLQRACDEAARASPVDDRVTSTLREALRGVERGAAFCAPGRPRGFRLGRMLRHLAPATRRQAGPQ